MQLFQYIWTYARIRNYDIKNFLHYKLTMSFFLMKDSYFERQENQTLQQS